MTPTISRILVPLDFSARSQTAMDYAAALALKMHAPMHFLHVMEPLATTAFRGEMYIPEVPDVEELLLAEVRDRMKDTLAQLPPGVTYTSEVMIGHPPTTIVKVASDRSCDLIVMGTHGRTGLAHLVMGSVAERVTREAPCPVLTVPPGRDTKNAARPAA